jgi:aminocarboxymuconate-semialdehyde decarboxylase
LTAVARVDAFHAAALHALYASHRRSRCTCGVTIKKKPSEYLKKLYFDTVVFDERELRHLIEIADHIMLGTDYPFDMAEPDPVGLLGSIKGVSKKDMALVAGGNAARLLGLPADA